MRTRGKFIVLIAFLLSYGAACYGANITGIVKGPDGAPFQAAFVEAQNTKSKITTIVLSNSQGKYRIENLAPGDYRVTIRAVGYRSDPRNGVSLAGDQNASLDFALQNDAVRWSDISIYQSKQLWPAGKGKDLIVAHCSICHAYQSRMAAVRRDADGWKDRVAYMRTAMHFSVFLGPHLSDRRRADTIASYLTQIFGPDSTLPKSPADMPEYKATMKSFSGDAMNVVYVEYDMPAPEPVSRPVRLQTKMGICGFRISVPPI